MVKAEGNFEIIVKTFQGLETVLADEIAALGGVDVQVLNRAVSFRGDKRLLYKANFALRTGLRVLVPLVSFKCRNERMLYDEVRRTDWSKFLGYNDSFAIDTDVFSTLFTHSKYVALKAKDAIADQFRENFGDRRPVVNLLTPHVRLNIRLQEDDCTLLLDSSGESLHQRGYRLESYKAPINEVLAAGLVRLSGWAADCNFMDGMCGAGTIAIEAALFAHNIAPNLQREYFAFKKWKDFDAQLLAGVQAELKAAEVPFEFHIKGYDLAFQAIRMAQRNAQRAGLDGTKITFERKDFFKNAPFAKGKLMMILNPPYDERIENEDIEAFYEAMGDRFKQHFVEAEIWVISSNMDALKCVGLRTSAKRQVFNGALECRFVRYEMYIGKTKLWVLDKPKTAN